MTERLITYSEALREAKRNPRALVIDLTKPLSTPKDNPLVADAREGVDDELANVGIVAREGANELRHRGAAALDERLDACASETGSSTTCARRNPAPTARQIER